MMKSSGNLLKRILVVEDEPAICEVCIRVLSDEGFEVDVAENGRIAQGRLGKKDYILCLIDIRTPIMNGKELYQYIINNHPGMAERVIFTTGDIADDYTQRFLELANRPFLPKPFTIGALREIVREFLKRLEMTEGRT
jgi:DNA-binding response OmpR family regulator